MCVCVCVWGGGGRGGGGVKGKEDRVEKKVTMVLWIALEPSRKVSPPAHQWQAYFVKLYFLKSSVCMKHRFRCAFCQLWWTRVHSLMLVETIFVSKIVEFLERELQTAHDILHNKCTY